MTTTDRKWEEIEARIRELLWRSENIGIVVLHLNDVRKLAALIREQREGVRENDAIAAAFREVIGPNGASIRNDEIADYITQRSKEITASAPQPEAPGAAAPAETFVVQGAFGRNRKARKQGSLPTRATPPAPVEAPGAVAGWTEAKQRETLVNCLRSSKSWMTGYAEAFVDAFQDHARTTPPAPVDVRVVDAAMLRRALNATFNGVSMYDALQCGTDWNHEILEAALTAALLVGEKP